MPAKLDVLLTTSSDPRFPPPNMLLDDGNKTFWLTTGMYPQEAVFQFVDGATSFAAIRLVCHGVSKLRIERCVDPHPTSFDVVVEAELPDATKGSNSVQSERFCVNKTTLGADVKYLKLVLLSGVEDFAAVYSLQVDEDES
eukprot:PhM_4_TR15531/c0_g2_i1/m.35886/K19369/HSPB11; heat shock protein beta-11